MATEKRILAVLCLCVLCGVLTAGLWPFFPPKNQVTWLPNQNGLSFGEYGTILSSANIWSTGSSQHCTIELWLQPDLSFDSNTILDIYTPETPFCFRIRQSGDDLEIRKNYYGYSNRNAPKVFVDHVFLRDRAVLITAVGDAKQTALYMDGQLVKIAPQFGLSSQDLRGQLIIGAAPVEDDRWSGQLLGLAIYKEALDPQRVAQNYRSWTHNWHPIVDDRMFALYTFSERSGRIVHSEVSLGPDLVIPKRFVVVGQAFLLPPWKEFSGGWGYYKNVFINVVGFIPLGLFIRAYLSSYEDYRKGAIITIVIGFATSLTIEVLQAFIPTRQSGMTDLITNTFGTGLGVLLWRSSLVQWVNAGLAEYHRQLFSYAHLRHVGDRPVAQETDHVRRWRIRATERT